MFGKREMKYHNAITIAQDTLWTLRDGERWGKGQYAVNDKGGRVEPDDTAACRWCLTGAIMKASRYGNNDMDSLEDVVEANDDPALDEFADALDLALLEKSKGGNCVFEYRPVSDSGWPQSPEHYNDSPSVGWFHIKALIERTIAILESRVVEFRKKYTTRRKQIKEQS